MGVRGLTTFIANRSRDYLENYQLHNTNIVIDGNSIASQLYKWHCRCNDCFGGDYDKFGETIKNFFNLLLKCDVKPIIIFDGGYEYRKLSTVYSRMRSKIRTARDINTINEGAISVFPLFIREVFVDIALEYQLKCLRCDFEGDSEIAYIAKTLGCPVLSYDSDFYIFDVLYIPFSTMELKLCKFKTKTKQIINYIPCQVYRIDKFLNSFGGLDKINLPILAALLGNDYIKKSVFKCFYEHLKIQGGKGGQSEQQKRIKSVITWLKNETPESAIRKILGRYKLKKRKIIARKIQNIINGYNCDNSDILKHLNLEAAKVTMDLKIPDAEDVESISSDIEETEVDDGTDESENDDIKIEVDIPTIEIDEKPTLDVPQYFHENFRKCLYPSCFIDMITRNTYYCIPQIEDFSQEQSHAISLNILTAIHKILTGPDLKNLACITRVEQRIQKKFLEVPSKSLPTLQELSSLSPDDNRRILSEILELNFDFLSDFPESWHIFIISLKYWIKQSKIVDLASIYSAILCGIILNYVDKSIGFYRSNKSFFAKFPDVIKDDTKVVETSITQSFNKIDKNNCIACLRNTINNFQMDAKMRGNFRLFDRTIIHGFAQFQSCLLHIKYLNSLLNFPYNSLIISNFYDGTFLYNLTTNLRKRTDVKSYLKILLGDCPVIFNTLELIANRLISDSCNILENPVIKKRRRRKTKPKFETEIEETENVVEDKEEYDDCNNKFSLLSI